MAAFAGCRGWSAFGHARLEDHARERFGRSGRWARELAALGRAVGSLPPLVDALTGDDGGPPLGRVASRRIGSIASAESVAAWVARARSRTVRELREEIAAARAAGSVWPLPVGAEEASAAPERSVTARRRAGPGGTVRGGGRKWRAGRTLGGGGREHRAGRTLGGGGREHRAG
ncbi:MAG: hypothetical protein PVF68_16715, partial [Acidobacteriota bacterium]